MLRRALLALPLAAALLPLAAAAAGPDVAVTAGDISISPAMAEYQPGAAVRVYVRIGNLGTDDAVAGVTLSVGNVQVGQASPVPVRAGGSAETWVDWTVPAEPFRLTAVATAAGDGNQRNNTARSAEFGVAQPQGRDIFSPPPGRESVPFDASATAAAIDASATAPATSTEPQPTPPAPVAYTPPAPEPADQAPLDGYEWIPYVLIAVGAVGFAWGVRGRRAASRPAPAPAPAAPPAAKPRRPRVYRPKLVVERTVASKPRRATRRRAAPPAEPTP